MEKRTLLAVVLSVFVISGFYVVQGIFFPPSPPPATTQAAPESKPEISREEPVLRPSTAVTEAVDESPVSEERVTIETELLRVTFTNAGGDMVSYKLKEHTEGAEFVEMILPGTEEPHAFTVAFGDTTAQPTASYFTVSRPSDYAVAFSRDFTLGTGEQGAFRLIKTYTFKPREYMFELTIQLEGGHTTPGFNFSGVAYTLSFGPQIGPYFEKLDQRYDYRHYYTYSNGKQKQEKVSDQAPLRIMTRPSWAAIAGKYFTFIALPYINQYDLEFSTRGEPGISSASRFSVIRPPVNSSRTEDTYRFYLGPKNQNSLVIYNNGNNDFNLRDMNLLKVANTSGFLAPLEMVLKWVLAFFYRIIPNYGVAILFLTFLVKALLFPLTKKGSEATLRMQVLSPKIKDIQAKYKDNPTKINAEMAELYKKEGYNPLAGCLPMLLQLPIFIAMYNLFNNHFDLRGALFIPGWIPDLSLPESIFSFAPFRLPLLGWSDIRLLPFIYVGSQLLYGKITQTPDQQGNAQMKMMLYVRPIVFF
ncbi:MAG: membrane protein insertase YidC, partial [Spirochaetaceae bacterium]|nr:membrane protein insertase YidC [Spirochaetaceae bacterium]